MNNKYLKLALRHDPEGFILPLSANDSSDLNMIASTGHALIMVESLESPEVAASHVLSLSHPAMGEYCLAELRGGSKNRLPRGVLKRSLRSHVYIKPDDSHPFVMLK